MESRIAVISIIVENSDSVECLNRILHEYGIYIIGRMGIPYRQRGISIISVAIDAPLDIINALTGKIGRLAGVSAKQSIRKLRGNENIWQSAELQIPEHIQETQNITREELEMILHTQNPLVTEELRRRAQQTAKAIYGNKNLCPWSDRIYKLLQEQLLLLWYTLFKYGCRQIPAFFGTDFVLL
mgnify:CR=1 FL=1